MKNLQSKPQIEYPSKWITFAVIGIILLIAYLKIFQP